MRTIELEGRLHPLGVVVLGWGWVQYAVYGGVISGLARGDLTIVLPIVVLAALVAAPFAFLAWKRFRYRVEGDQLIVERGVLVEQQRVVPLDRIRGVDISAPLLHRVLGLVEASVDAAAAGGGASELKLAAVTREQAETLRAQVLERSRGPVTPSATPRQAPTIARVGYRTLALAGATSTRWLLAPLVALGALSNFLFRDESTTRRVGETVLDVLPSGVVANLVLGIGGVVVAVVIAAIGSMLVDGGFRLARDGDQITAERGVLRRRSVSIDRARISALEVRDTPLWRMFNLASLRALVAGVGAGEGEGRGRTNLLPADTESKVWRLARATDRRVARDLTAHPRPARFRRILRATAVPAVAALFAAPFQPVLAAVFAVAILPAVALGIDRYRSLGHAFINGRISLRGGSIARRHTIIDPGAVASYRVGSTPFQRRRGLCTLNVNLGRGAGGGTGLDIGESQVVDLLHEAEPALMAQFGATRHSPERRP